MRIGRLSSAVMVIALGLAITSGPTAAPVRAAPGDFTLTPTDLDFGSLAVGESSDIDVTVTNISAVEQTPAFAGGAPLDATNYSASQNCGGVTLAPAATCTFTYTFQPTTTGTLSTTTSIGIDGEVIPITLTGVGTFPFTLTPTDLDFGEVLVGGSSDIDVTVTNISAVEQTPAFAGGAPLDATNYSASQDCGGVTLAPAATCTFTYTFQPTVTGILSTTTSIGIDGEVIPITLTGVGTFITSTTTTTTIPATTTTSPTSTSTIPATTTTAPATTTTTIPATTTTSPTSTSTTSVSSTSSTTTSTTLAGVSTTALATTSSMPVSGGLPPTGGSGVSALVMLGALLSVVGGLALVVTRRTAR